MKKIKTKDQAIHLLDSLILKLNETAFFTNERESNTLFYVKNELIHMQNSINYSDDFFSSFFLEKTEEEIIDWIENEAKGWNI